MTLNLPFRQKKYDARRGVEGSEKNEEERKEVDKNESEIPLYPLCSAGVQDQGLILKDRKRGVFIH